MENAVSAFTAGSSGGIVVAGAGYAGLHVALRLTAKLRDQPKIELTLVNRHDYHQAITELPRVAGGTRAADAVRIRLQDVLAKRVRFVQTEISGFDLASRRLLTGAGPVGWGRLVLALGSRPNDFAIPGLAERTLSLYSASDAERVWAAVSEALTAAAAAADLQRQRCLATVVVGGGGATGVELAGELAEMLPEVARRHGLAPDRPAVQLVESGPTILAGSSPQLIGKASKILSDLGVEVRTNAAIAAATEEGFRLKDGQLVEGGVFVWAGGLKAPELVGRLSVADRPQRPRQGQPVPAGAGPPGDLRGRRPRLGDRSAHRARAAPAGAGGAGGRRDGGPQPGRGATGPAAGGVHLPRQRVRRLRRDPPRGRRHRRHHHRRAAGPSAQRRHRVGVPPDRAAPARLGPSTRVTRPLRLRATKGTDARPHRRSRAAARRSSRSASSARAPTRSVQPRR